MHVLDLCLVVHYWTDLQSVHVFRCYDNIARTRNVNECLYSLYAWLDYVAAFGWWWTQGDVNSVV